jgi:ribosomal protein S18 acetylase RimI-like enzyme
MTRPWDDAAEKERFLTTLDLENSSIILFDGTPVGWFALSGDATHISIDHAYVANSYQRKGIGSILVEYIRKGAGKMGKTVLVETLKNGTASRFFEKQGFRKHGDGEITTKMEAGNKKGNTSNE